MKLTLNGQNETLENETLTIEELLKIKDVKMPEMVTVEHNGEILERTSFAITSVKEGDTLEFLYFMGGGSH